MFPFAEEQAALCRDRLVIRSVKPMENKKRKKWNGYLAAGLFMTGLAVFWGFWDASGHHIVQLLCRRQRNLQRLPCIIFLEQTISEGIFFQE